LDDSTSNRTTLYGGYRWANDVAVEAAFNAADPYALRPADPNPVRRGIGVVPSAGSLGLATAQSRTWNLDLYTSWGFLRHFALYGRLGYAQTDSAPTAGSFTATAADGRRLRDGVNYGVGIRYDMTSALGLRLEYGRFGRFAGELGSSSLESDQVTIGLQFRF
jgi:opacity protein-like surface antigen